MFKFGVKTAVLGTAVYYTVDKGVWKDSATTSALYEDIGQTISPYFVELKNQIPYELPPLPSNDRLAYLFKHYWNSGVKTTFRFLINLPTTGKDVANKVYGQVFSTLEAEDQNTNSKKDSK